MIKSLNMDTIKDKLIHADAVVQVATPITGTRYATKLFRNLIKVILLPRGRGHDCVCKGVLCGTTGEYNETLENCCKNDKIVSFSIVRNPYDIFTSYHFDGNDGIYNLNKRLGVISGNFDSFVREYFTRTFNYHLHNSRRAAPYTRRFLFYRPFDSNGSCVVDFIIRFEHMDTAFSQIYELFGKKHNPIKNSHKTNLKHYNYKHYWSDELIEWVQPYFKRQLDFFGYNFDGPLDDYAILDPSQFKYNPLTDKIG